MIKVGSIIYTTEIIYISILNRYLLLIISYLLYFTYLKYKALSETETHK